MKRNIGFAPSSESRRPQRAVICSPHRWDGDIQVGGHHLARALARRGWEVMFVANPISPPHLCALGGRGEVAARIRACLSGMRRDADTGILFTVPFTLLPLTARFGAGSNWVLRNWQQMTLPFLPRRMTRLGFADVDILLLDGPVQVGWLDQLQARRTVLRVADRTSAFPSTTPAILEAERDLARRVDFVVYSAVSLETYVDQLTPRRRLALPNGVDFDHFAARTPTEPSAYAAIPRPRAVYAGAMTGWFDFAAVDAAARALPNVSFVLIGDTERARRCLTARSNLHLLGSVPWHSLPAYLQHADVGLIPFKMDENRALIDGVNPLKLLEYLASGLPVVARSWEELRRMGSPARLYDNGSELGSTIAAMLADPPDPGALRDFARHQDWAGRIDALLRALDLADASHTPIQRSYQAARL